MAISAIEACRSIRCYDPEYAIPKEDIEKILKAASNAPSTLNCQDIDFVVITNKKVLQDINDQVFDNLKPQVQQRYIDRQIRYHTSQKIMYDCSACILLVKNERATGMEQVNAGIALMAILTAATELGLASVPMGILVRPEVEKICNLPQGSLVVGLGFGKARSPDVDPKPNLRKIFYIE
ncbi:nitroreductase family protein [Trichomonas vaginalis G3]|uniref:Nitroreductase family protein n=1 Tax=Trichomonas vaginalis (strain ATCC PRA-98 / G3) TaxID=412133 RepID=A2GB50_TRIV3|nr:nitroreductase family protein [Trichomonas vaginalis G3]|eukprot:XP_001298549.1 nitroreductase family protein [Trichomonas vaginalis G3]